MIAVRLITASHFALLIAPLLAAESSDSLTLDGAQSELQTEDELPSPYSELPLMGGGQVLDPNQTLIEGYEPIGTPDWTKSPYRQSGWRFGFISSIPDGDEEFAIRAHLGYEHPDGVGKRGEFWLYEEEFGVPFGRVDFLASTFYFDYYKRFYYHEAELLLGGGFAVGHLAFDSTRFYGGGGSLVAEGFLPFHSGKKSDFGAVGKGRLAGLIGDWDKGSVGTRLDDEWAMLVEEFSWGLEFRRRVGNEMGRFWYVNLMREHRIWSEAELATSSDVLIESTVLNFGMAW
jgi:hypothetical protein